MTGSAQILQTVEPSTLGECTGLTDKNGELIFEGDIVKSADTLYVVAFIDPFAMFALVYVSTGTTMTDFTINKAEDLEIIGNIHDNPELLERRCLL